MRHILTLLVALPLLMLPGCNGEGGDEVAVPQSAEVGREFIIRFGETIRVGELALEFTTVVEESRCPASATCVWEGNARILVAAHRDRATSMLELNTSPRFATFAVFEGYVISLRDLQPYPATPTTSPLPQGYSATLFVDPQVLPAGS